MKIVILDGYTLNPGDLSWEWLNEFGEVEIFDRTPHNLIDERVSGADVIITNKTPLTKQTLEKLDNLKYIGLLSTGYNIVDCEYARQMNVPVTNVPAYSTQAVAQLVFAFILEFANQVALHSSAVHSGKWASSTDFSFSLSNLTEINSKTLGIIGFGSIGMTVAKIANAFGMKVLVDTPHPKYNEDYAVEWVSRDELLKKSDFVSIHCPLKPETTNMVNDEFLNKMKNTAFLINTSRGAVVDEKSLARALKNNIIAGAGLDVLEFEPPKKENELYSINNCFITPHIAWAGFETRSRLMQVVKNNFVSFIENKLQNVVN